MVAPKEQRFDGWKKGYVKGYLGYQELNCHLEKTKLDFSWLRKSKICEGINCHDTTVSNLIWSVQRVKGTSLMETQNTVAQGANSNLLPRQNVHTDEIQAQMANVYFHHDSDQRLESCDGQIKSLRLSK